MLRAISEIMSKKVAIIDDDKDIVDVLDMAFTGEGYSTKVALRADETVAIAKKFKPDLIVLDVVISGKDGRVVCKELKNTPDTKNIPVVMMSAHASARSSALEMGADCFIAKPFNLDDMLSVSRKLTAS